MNIRNVAIIAHVDHGKTTLVDSLLVQSKTNIGKVLETSDLIMDSNDLEKERGITIFSKNAAIVWQGTKINIIDTPGHADFGGEVERVLRMADGCLLLIDAKEGPMPQTRFVLKKALEMKHRIIVVINKIDKANARVQYVLGKTLDLFLELGADDQTADFPIIYSSGKLGVAGFEENLSVMKDITPVFESILKYIPAPLGKSDAPLQMLVTTLDSDLHLGRIAIGRVYNGTMVVGDEIAHIDRSGNVKQYRLTSLMTYEGLKRVNTKEALVGDIVAISGIPGITIGETIASASTPVSLPLLSIEEPTISMTFTVNTSPFAGKEGKYKTSRQIRERLYKELETDVALRVKDDPAGGWVVSGRGELHLAIFIERLRRQGYEFQVSMPRIIEKMVDGQKLVPFERIFIEVPQKYSGIVMQKLGVRRAQLIDMQTEGETTYFEFTISTQNLFGYRSEFMTDTKGLGILNASFMAFQKADEIVRQRVEGSLVAHESGTTNLYGLVNTQDRGELFVGPAVLVYKGQVVGRHSREGDLIINVCKAKHLTNMRSKGEGRSQHFDTPKIMDLEDALEYIAEDELVEVTPKNIRIRKAVLDPTEEKRKRSQGLI